jgi:hypothetical protein
MTAVTRRVFEMCVRVLAWIGAHPDDEPGFLVLAARLQTLVSRMTQVIDDQRGGRKDTRAARVRKEELRRAILAGPVTHLARIGALIGGEQHALRTAFIFKPSANTLVAFQRTARAMYAEAQANLEVLVQHGLSASVLVQFGKWLDEFDAAMVLGAEGRTVHTAATRELEALTRDAAATVGAMDARVRLRMQGERQALEQWVSARTVIGTPVEKAKDDTGTQGGTPAAGGNVRPAA